MKNAKSEDFVYVGHESREAIVQDESGKTVEPTTLVKLAEKNYPESSNKNVKIEHFIVRDIVEKL